MGDRMDDVVREWEDLRPDLDFATFGVVARLLRAAHYLQSSLDDLATAYGLSHTGDLDSLTDLYRSGPPYERTPSELAEALLLTPGGMTVRLDRLQSAALVERRPNPSDGRGILVRLTPKGQRLAEAALGSQLERQRADLQSLDATQRADLAGLLRTLLSGLGDVPAFRPEIVADD